MSEVDLDRLADFADGLLEPGPATEVARLVRTDPAWAGALAQLRTANDEVSRLLRDAPAVPMPALVAARLDAALRTAARQTDPQPVPAGDTPLGTVVALESRRRRWPRVLAAGTGIAAAAVAVTFGITTFGGVTGTTTSSTKAGGRPAVGAESAPQLGAGGDLSAVLVLASGRDYTATTVTTVTALTVDGAQSTDRSSAPPGAQQVPGPAMALAPVELAALLSVPGRAACLRAVVSTYGGQPQLLDYARFDGRPALVIVLGTANRVVVAGPDCGQPGHGTDEIFSAPVG